MTVIIGREGLCRVGMHQHENWSENDRGVCPRLVVNKWSSPGCVGLASTAVATVWPCTSHVDIPARGPLLCEGQREASIVKSSCFGIWVRIPPELVVLTIREASSEYSHLPSQPSPQRFVLAWSPLDANTYVLTDPSTHLVEPSLLSSRACAVLQQARHAPSPRSPLATPRRRSLVVKSDPNCSL